MLAIPASKKDIPARLSAIKLTEKNSHKQDEKINTKKIKANNAGAPFN